MQNILKFCNLKLSFRKKGSVQRAQLGISSSRSLKKVKQTQQGVKDSSKDLSWKTPLLRSLKFLWSCYIGGLRSLPQGFLDREAHSAAVGFCCTERGGGSPRQKPQFSCHLKVRSSTFSIQCLLTASHRSSLYSKQRGFIHVTIGRLIWKDTYLRKHTVAHVVSKGRGGGGRKGGENQMRLQNNSHSLVFLF